MRETRLHSPGREDLLEKEMATHSCILAWEIPWTEEPSRLQSMGRKESDTTERFHFHFKFWGWGISIFLVSIFWVMALLFVHISPSFT